MRNRLTSLQLQPDHAHESGSLRAEKCALVSRLDLIFMCHADGEHAHFEIDAAIGSQRRQLVLAAALHLHTRGLIRNHLAVLNTRTHTATPHGRT